jgi:endoglucanase
MREIARMHEIGFQECALGRAAPNDSNALQLARAGVATGLVGIPNRYMHSAVEIVNYRDLDRSADLLARFLESVMEEDDWTP